MIIPSGLASFFAISWCHWNVRCVPLGACNVRGDNLSLFNSINNKDEMISSETQPLSFHDTSAHARVPVLLYFSGWCCPRVSRIPPESSECKIYVISRTLRNTYVNGIPTARFRCHIIRRFIIYLYAKHRERESIDIQHRFSITLFLHSTMKTTFLITILVRTSLHAQKFLLREILTSEIF